MTTQTAVKQDVQEENDSTSPVVRLEPNGPAGIGMHPTDYVAPETVIGGNPKEIGFNFFVNKAGNVSAGVWEVEAYKERMDNYPVDEFCYVLEGRLIITPDGGPPEEFKQGDAFVLRRGTSGVWDCPETFKKYYVIVEPKE
jgi:uncharacterized cupin superfamily protein